MKEVIKYLAGGIAAYFFLSAVFSLLFGRWLRRNG